MAQRRIIPEQIFTADHFAPFYGDEMASRDWNSLWYSTEDFYHEDLVRRFYNTRELEGSKIFVLVRKKRRELTTGLLAEILGIPPRINLDAVIQDPQFDGVEPLMGVTVINGSYNPNSHCVRQASLRTNQLATAQWIGRNVLGKDKVSDIGLTCLHVLWILQERKYDFCILEFLLNIIRRIGRSLAPLPVLITKIMLKMKATPASERIYITLHGNPRIYRECVQQVWKLPEDREQAEEEEQRVDEDESEEDEEDGTCFDTDAFQRCWSDAERMTMLHRGMRSLNTLCADLRTRQATIHHNFELRTQREDERWEQARAEMEAQRQFRVEMLARFPPQTDSASEDTATRHERRRRRTTAAGPSGAQEPPLESVPSATSGEVFREDEQ